MNVLWQFQKEIMTSLSFAPQKQPPFVYMPFTFFCFSCSGVSICAAPSSSTSNAVHVHCPRCKLKTNDYCIHCQVSGHINYSDIEQLFERNNMRNDDTDNYLPQVLKRWDGCRSAFYPKTSRKLLLKSINRPFDNCICVDHKFLDAWASYM